MRSKNWRIIIPRDLTNFTNAGTLDPNESEATAQAALLSGPPLPPEELVCFEDWYSDEEQSDAVEAIQTSREVLSSPTTT